MERRARLAEARRRHPRLRVVQHAQNCGQSTAMLRGVRAARAPWVATLDGDGQNDPGDILRLYRLAAAPEGRAPAMVVGWRRRRNDTLVRRWSSRSIAAALSAPRPATVAGAIPRTSYSPPHGSGCGPRRR
ncbi:MAG: glycosyltransferase [Gammaproteobacteria bacterium]|nr:glycosyltransferase [Gammaproteobacteria bacterium]